LDGLAGAARSYWGEQPQACQNIRQRSTHYQYLRQLRKTERGLRGVHTA